jgi:putative ABC transport system permease protein
MRRTLQILGMAWQSITGHLLRSLLMMLGVTIGVAAVIALIAAGNGASAQVAARIENLGANLLFVNPGPGTQLTVADIRAAMPVISSSGPLVYGGQTESVPISGVTQLWVGLRDAPVASGRFISAQDVREAAFVMDVGSNVASTVFGGLNPLGRQVRLAGDTFTVIGVMAPKGAAYGQDQDDVVFIPVTTAELLLETTEISAIDAQATSAASAGVAADELQRYYTYLYQGNPQAVQVSSEDALLSTVEGNRRTFTFLLGGTAAISLLVGGIGIMNIMLVSVSERTREIGLRKAVGAKFRDILLQFLAEAVVLSGLGGLVGVALGVSGSGAVAHLAGWKDVIVPVSVVAAFAFSLAVGILFGAYPAARAAGLDPIEALRRD